MISKLAEVVDVLGAGVEHRRQHVVLGQAVLLQRDDALAGEQVGHRPGVGHVAAVAGDGHPDLARRPIAVVGQAFDQDRDAVGPIALVHDRLVVGATGLLARAALAGPLDVVVGHRGLLRLLDGVIQGRVAGGVTAAGAGGDLDVLDQPGEFLAAARL